MLQKSIRPNILISILVILSYLPIMLVDRHAIMPLFLLEFYVIPNLFTTSAVLLNIIPLLAIVIGKILFVIFAFRKTSGYKTILLLSSLLILNLGLSQIFKQFDSNYLEITYKTTIPFWSCSILFYIFFLLKIKRHTTHR